MSNYTQVAPTSSEREPQNSPRNALTWSLASATSEAPKMIPMRTDMSRYEPQNLRGKSSCDHPPQLTPAPNPVHAYFLDRYGLMNPWDRSPSCSDSHRRVSFTYTTHIHTSRVNECTTCIRPAHTILGANPFFEIMIVFPLLLPTI